MNPYKFINCSKVSPNYSGSAQTTKAQRLQATPKCSSNSLSNSTQVHPYSKITEKDCTDLQSLVKKSVDDINDLFNLKELKIAFNNATTDLSRKKRTAVSLSRDEKPSVEPEPIKFEKDIKETKNNFTLNINNFINVPNKKVKQITRYVDEEETFDTIDIRSQRTMNQQKQPKVSYPKSANFEKINPNKTKKSSQNHVNKVITNVRKSNTNNITVNRLLAKGKLTSNTTEAMKTDNDNSFISKTKTERGRSISTTSNKRNFYGPCSPIGKVSPFSFNNNTNNNTVLSNSTSLHSLMNNLYQKEFPHNKLTTNDILKLMLFLNEYLINSNVLKDYYIQSNQKLLNDYSLFLSKSIEIDYPQEDDIDHSRLDKVVNSTKIIQRMWRKIKITKFLGKNNNETHEIKKMIISDYIQKSGFKVKKITGLFNAMAEAFSYISNESPTNEMLNSIIKLMKKTLTPYEKNILYKKYMNRVVLAKI